MNFCHNYQMVASKFLHDDGEEDEVFNKEWANSGQVTISRMNKLEKDFLAAIVSTLSYILFSNNEIYCYKIMAKIK